MYDGIRLSASGLMPSNKVKENIFEYFSKEGYGSKPIVKIFHNTTPKDQMSPEVVKSFLTIASGAKYFQL